MSLDVHTIMVLFAMLSVIFSGLILLAGLHTKNISSVRQWSVANLCIGVGLGFSYFLNTPPTPIAKFAIMLGATLIAASVALQFTGIQSFKSRRNYIWLALLFVGFATFQTYWFEFVHPDIGFRSIANSILLSIGYAACACVLLNGTKSSLRAVSWFTGLSFALLSALLLIRAILISQFSTEPYSLYSNTSINPITFVVTCILQLCITFGFLLMLNQKLVVELEKLASRDMLTGAFNRRQLEEEITRLQSHGARTGDIFSLLLIDIDNFKFINDNYGHPSGDEVLRRLTNIALASIRAEDYFARYGGDEFCILLPTTSANEAFILANRLREIYASATFVFGGKTILSSISIGLADSSKIGMEFKNLISAADQALYRAKKNGRNNVVLH
jgi:diguanylate cyclase (GGDEF)-like protein